MVRSKGSKKKERALTISSQTGQHLIKTCYYNTGDPNQSQEANALRDRIVTGIMDPTTREGLLRIDDLTLEKAIRFCRTLEQSKSQSSKRVEQVESIRNIEQSSADSDDLFVNQVRKEKYTDREVSEDFCENLSIEKEKVKVRLDTGADVSVIPLRIFEKIDKQFKVRHTQYILKGFEGSQAKPIGIVNSHRSFENREIYEDFVIVDGANQVLVGGQACLNLKLIEIINNINVQDANLCEKYEFINKNPKIFKGFGRFPGKHNIPTEENLENVCHPPSEIPFAIRDQFKVELDRLVDRKAILKVYHIAMSQEKKVSFDLKQVKILPHEESMIITIVDGLKNNEYLQIVNLITP
ncbi:hypothetical protein JTB14_016486 [Gonioctena quinquepunctata]|nr:hypothetical protein JTB14_016486 [Gonioctena quinquepunctata]